VLAEVKAVGADRPRRDRLDVIEIALVIGAGDLGGARGETEKKSEGDPGAGKHPRFLHTRTCRTQAISAASQSLRGASCIACTA
jgi:hypothetical protein